ncbi:fimbrial protein [Proteus faecis]|uniref:fimbrial protein n=1 Tax=Proteus faecis TaxID=2050967 RepID=UPI0020C0BD69
MFICCSSIAYAANGVGTRYEGKTQIVGSVIATPCSIIMKNRYQTVDFSSLTLEELSTTTSRESLIKPFYIELKDCGSLYSLKDSKAWVIRFDGKSSEYINAFILQGPSKGLGISVLDNTKNILMPGRNYPLFNNVLRKDKSGNTFLLRYFLRLELTGMPFKAGNYQGLIRFFIDYQ